MSSRSSTLTNLNPSAPAYKPIPPGVTPNADAPPPSFLLTTPQAALHQSVSPTGQPTFVFVPTQFLTYTHRPTIPDTPHPPFYPTYSCYFIPQSTIPTDSLPEGEFFMRDRRPGVRCNWPMKRAQCGKGKGKLLEERKESHEKKNNLGLWRDEEFSSTHKVLPRTPNEDETTIMIKNIPYVCSRQDLINALDIFCCRENHNILRDESFICAYDLLYLPIDFSTEKSRGFAFVNFTNSRGVRKFVEAFQFERWPLVHVGWTKKIQVVSAKIQGKEALVHHLSGSAFECGTDDFLPVRFVPARDGSGQPVEVTVIGKRGASSHFK